MEYVPKLSLSAVDLARNKIELVELNIMVKNKINLRKRSMKEFDQNKPTLGMRSNWAEMIVAAWNAMRAVVGKIV